MTGLKDASSTSQHLDLQVVAKCAHHEARLLWGLKLDMYHSNT